jgi:predicted AlkP superfamily pyrophosphatase or phosphodiesterase
VRTGRFVCATILSATCIAIPNALLARNGHPTLVVQITADQLRGDLLDRYRSALTDGLARIENGGYWIHQGQVDHGITLSFPGHATLATGMHPFHHGLTANEWWVNQKGTWGELEVSADDRYNMLDTPVRRGPSPGFLTATTLGEWVKASNPRSKSVALGTGNPIPIAYAGNRSDAAYWYDDVSGRFTSSTFYSAEMKPWVAAFNANKLSKYQPQVWVLTVPSAWVGLANPDATSYENFGKHNTFPHDYAGESHLDARRDVPTPYSHWFASTPMKDEALLGLAADAVDAEKLGQRGVTDYLAIDIGSTDDVGHDYGPLSLEQLDTLMRLDHALGRFLDHLDTTIGKGNYVLAFSADHGVTDPPEATGEGRRVTSAEIDSVLDRVDMIATAETGSREVLIEKIVTELKRADFIADAYSEARLASLSKDPFVKLYQHMFRKGFATNFPLWGKKPHLHHPARYGIVVRFKENMVIDAATGIHGSPYAADRLVPIIFYGTNIATGSRILGGRTVDVAPTLAAAARIRPPRALDGVVLTSILRDSHHPNRTKHPYPTTESR